MQTINELSSVLDKLANDDKFRAQLLSNPVAFQHIGILSLEFHVDKLSRPLL